MGMFPIFTPDLDPEILVISLLASAYFHPSSPLKGIPETAWRLVSQPLLLLPVEGTPKMDFSLSLPC